MQEHFQFSRRRAMQLGVGAATIGVSGCRKVPTVRLDLKNLSAEDAFRSYIKTIGTTETSDVYVWFKGVLWGAIPNRLPVAFCGFQGLARHRWVANADGSFSQKAYDVGFFSDLETGRPVDFIVNPLTREKVKTFHNSYGGSERIHTLAGFMENPPENTGPNSQLEWHAIGDQAILTERSTGQVKSKMLPGEWPRESSGPVNFYGGETNYSVSLAALSDSRVNAVDYTLFWSSFSPWEPWLLMNGAAGICQWRATGKKLKSHQDVPDDMLKFVKKTQPNYFGKEDPWEGVLSNTDRYMKAHQPASFKNIK